MTDPREVAVRRECTRALEGLVPGTPAYDRELEEATAAFRARRNVSGGFWLAKDDPRAAEEAVCATLPVPNGAGVGVLSNGASRLVDPYQLITWPELSRLLHRDGPAEAIRMLRAAEAARRGHGDDPRADDATVVWARFDSW